MNTSKVSKPVGMLAAAALLLGGVSARADQALSWGYNAEGELGNGTTNNSNKPVAVSGMSSGVTAADGGGQHSLAMQNGGLYAWGSNAYGQYGNGTTKNSVTPVPVSGMSSGVTAFAAGLEDSLAIQNGGLYAWGCNFNGELGNGTTSGLNPNPTPVPVIGMSSGVTAVAAGGATGNDDSFAVKNGGLYAWGYNA